MPYAFPTLYKVELITMCKSLIQLPHRLLVHNRQHMRVDIHGYANWLVRQVRVEEKNLHRLGITIPDLLTYYGYILDNALRKV